MAHVLFGKPVSTFPEHALDPELVGEVVEVLGHDIERTPRLALAGARTALARPPDMAGAQPELLGRRQVVTMRGAHHDLLGLEVERLAGREIDLGLRLVALTDLGAEDRVPRQIVAPPHIGHQRNIAVRAWRHQEALVEPRKPWTDIGPGIEL